mmetsp:Transcript_46632/g.146194  ORF Transcript_46632/g.146194 Transcript_46632/m.146194 type:complete len:302 (-) Transcript_46632:567-1472(-)
MTLKRIMWARTSVVSVVSILSPHGRQTSLLELLDHLPHRLGRGLHPPPPSSLLLSFLLVRHQELLLLRLSDVDDGDWDIRNCQPEGSEGIRSLGGVGDDESKLLLVLLGERLEPLQHFFLLISEHENLRPGFEEERSDHVSLEVQSAEVAEDRVPWPCNAVQVSWLPPPRERVENHLPSRNLHLMLAHELGALGDLHLLHLDRLRLVLLVDGRQGELADSLLVKQPQLLHQLRPHRVAVWPQRLRAPPVHQERDPLSSPPPQLHRALTVLRGELCGDSVLEVPPEDEVPVLPGVGEEALPR